MITSSKFTLDCLFTKEDIRIHIKVVEREVYMRDFNIE